MAPSLEKALHANNDVVGGQQARLRLIRGTDAPQHHVPRFFVVAGPGSYEWRPHTFPTTNNLEPGQVKIQVVSEVPSPGTFKGYDDGTFAKLKGRTDPKTRIYEPDPEHPEEQYPWSIGYAEGAIVIGANNPAYHIGQDVSADITLRDQAIVDPEAQPNKLWTPHPDIHPSLIPITRKIVPIALNAVLHAVDELSGDRNLTPDDIHTIVSQNRFAVNGAGPLGLITGKILQALDAQDLVTTDVKAPRVALAKEMGIEHAYNPLDMGGGKQFAKFVKTELMSERPGNAEDKLYGPGPQVIIDFTGSRRAIQDSFDTLQVNGFIVDAGMHRDGEPMNNSFQEHTAVPTIVIAQAGFVPRRQHQAWGMTRNPLSGFGEEYFLLEDDTSRVDGGTHGDTLRESLITHIGPFSEAPQMYTHIMWDRATELSPWRRHLDTQTTGYVLLLNDQLPSDTLRRYHPDSPMPASRQDRRERIEVKSA